MGYFQDLFSVSGKLNILSIFLVASILTIFEIVFFYSVIVPDLNDRLDDKFKSIEEYINEIPNKDKGLLNELFVNTFYEKYKTDISRNNSYKINGSVNGSVNGNKGSYGNSKINEQFSNKNSGGVSEIKKSIDNILNVLVDRENELIEKNNSNTIVVSVTILLFLSFFILSTILSIKNAANYTGPKMFIEPLIVAFITVGFLIGFQVLFYNFGKNFKYPSNSETLKIAVDSLELD